MKFKLNNKMEIEINDIETVYGVVEFGPGNSNDYCFWVKLKNVDDKIKSYIYKTKDEAQSAIDYLKDQMRKG